jgi:hypothetical protein
LIVIKKNKVETEKKKGPKGILNPSGPFIFDPSGKPIS